MKRKPKAKRKSTPRATRIEWTLVSAAVEFGISRETIRRGLSSNGITCGRERRYSTKEIHNAISGDFKAARTRETLANAIARERENLEAEKVLVPLVEVERLYVEALLPIRQRLLSLPSEAASRCNPTDPQFAREALQRWLDDALPLIRAKLPKAL